MKIIPTPKFSDQWQHGKFYVPHRIDPRKPFLLSDIDSSRLMNVLLDSTWPYDGYYMKYYFFATKLFLKNLFTLYNIDPKLSRHRTQQ